MPKWQQLWGLFALFVTMVIMAIARKQQDFKVAASIPTTPASYNISTIAGEVSKLTLLGLRDGIRGGISKLKSASFTYFISNIPFLLTRCLHVLIAALIVGLLQVIASLLQVIAR